MKAEEFKTVAVIGAGDMGHGIAEGALIAGIRVFLRDTNQELLDKGVSRIFSSLDKLVSKTKVSAELCAKIKTELLVPCLDLETALKEADLVIETIPEILSLKKKVFEQIDQAAPAHALLASNTSTMRISVLAAFTKRPTQVLGLHYFNPAVLMQLVEVVRGEQTCEAAMQLASDFVKRIDKVPVRVEKESPGFIVHRTLAPSGILLGCYLDQGIVEPEEVDALMHSLGMPMGPYETMDYNGLEIPYHGGKYFAETLHPDYEIGPTIARLVESGNLGKKTGKGIYDWSLGRPKIDLSRATQKLDPLDLLAVNLNEATKIIEIGACQLDDIDMALRYATGNPLGLVQNAADIEPEDLTRRLQNLAKTFQKEIFLPTETIKAGLYR